MYYKGSTKDLARRLQEHNSGKQRFTKSGVPWQLVLVIEKSTIREARQLELKLKNITTRVRLESFILKYGGKLPY